MKRTPSLFVFLSFTVLLTASFFFYGCAKVHKGVPLASSASASDKKPATYYCPMHTFYRSDKPGNCPICGMTLVLLESPPVSTAAASAAPQAVKPVNAQTTCVRHECPMIKAGQTCPMLIVSETGEIPQCPVCKKTMTLSELTPVPSDHPEGYTVVALSPAKQRLIGVKTAQIKIRPLKTSIRTAGLMLASSEMNLFIYESDLPRITDNSTVKATFPALGKELEGAVSRIPLSLDRGQPMSSYGPGVVLNASSNQATVRARINDPDRLLRRGMTADVEILTDLGSVTALPEEAAFFTGKQTLIFVQRSEGVYEPRAVKLGARADGYYAVQSGVEPGETVVTSGNFLIDSESRLKSALADIAAAGEAPADAHGN